MSYIESLKKRFTYHKVTGSPVEDMKTIRINSLNLALIIEATVPDVTERGKALNKLEEVVMWANAGIARHHGEPQ